MGLAFEFISGQVTAPSTTLTAWTMNGTDSLTVRNADGTKRNYLLATTFRNQVAGVCQILSPRMHDAVQGIRVRIPATDVYNYFPSPYPQILYPTDTLTAKQSGSGVAGKIEQGGMFIFYEDLPGVAAQLISPADAMKGPGQIMAQEVTLTAGTTGGYSGAAAVNANFDNWRAGQYYALLGGMCDTDGLAITIKGADTGNLRVAFPAQSTNKDVTSRWFWWLSTYLALPLIPKFNANNRNAITVEAVTNDAGGTYNVTLFFYLLA